MVDDLGRANALDCPFQGWGFEPDLGHVPIENSLRLDHHM